MHEAGADLYDFWYCMDILCTQEVKNHENVPWLILGSVVDLIAGLVGFSAAFGSCMRNTEERDPERQERKLIKSKL